MIDEGMLKSEEKAVYALRSLYRKYGYLPFKMSKFEEYDLYARNKEFLVSDRVITFNDTNGRLMALKPDVTLSIVKNGTDQPGVKQKLCYSENVYRVSGSARQFREIMQAGLECIGDLDAYDLFEVVSLAAKSLALISGENVLVLSHLGLLSALLDSVSADERLQKRIAACIASKNQHDLQRLCRDAGVTEAGIRELCFFTGLYGELGAVIEQMDPYCESANARRALGELKTLHAMLCKSGLNEGIVFDFSLVNDREYYNGIVFKGFLKGIPESVLAGGQYDRLMRRVGRRACAIGFAVYLDLLEELAKDSDGYDVDVLLLYDRGEDAAAAVDGLIREGKSVSAQHAPPEKLRWRELLDLRGGRTDA